MNGNNGKPWYHALYVRSPLAKIGYGILAVVLTLGVILFLSLFENSRMEAQAESWEGRSIEIGASLFAGNCSSCHQLDGKGAIGVAPALHSKYFFEQRLSDVGWNNSLEQYIQSTLYAGRPSKGGRGYQWSAVMPTWSQKFGQPLRDDQIVNVTNYVLNWEESALAQTPEEDPWIFFQDTLSTGLPYDPTEPGYEEKVQAALAAAEAAGVSEYTLGEETFTIEQTASADGDARAPQELYVSMGCQGCHSLDDPDTILAGPYQGDLHETAGTRVEGLTAEEYVYQSIVAPNEYIVDGYVAGVMPQTFSEQMSEAEIRGLVDWMLDPNREQ